MLPVGAKCILCTALAHRLNIFNALNRLVSLLGLGVRIERTLFFANYHNRVRVIWPDKIICNAPKLIWVKMSHLLSGNLRPQPPLAACGEDVQFFCFF